MTINGPAPMILAMFMNTAIDQQVERWLRENGRWDEAERRIAKLFERPRASALPRRAAGRPRRLRARAARRQRRRSSSTRRPTRASRADALAQVRGTVQADILKEDQAQNTCIFSTEFALRMMGDVQQYLHRRNRVRNFYSVSISGYHIAEAGANPISQLAFTLANGFTIVEYYLSRGMKVDDFAPNLSLLLLERHGPGVRGDRAGRAAHLGARDARPLRRRRRAARC